MRAPRRGTPRRERIPPPRGRTAPRVGPDPDRRRRGERGPARLARAGGVDAASPRDSGVRRRRTAAARGRARGARARRGDLGHGARRGAARASRGSSASCARSRAPRPSGAPRRRSSWTCPDFNLRLAAKLKKLGIPVVYYVSPTIWAWRQGRARKIAKVVDRMLCILPVRGAVLRRAPASRPASSGTRSRSARRPASPRRYREDLGLAAVPHDGGARPGQPPERAAPDLPGDARGGGAHPRDPARRPVRGPGRADARARAARAVPRRAPDRRREARGRPDGGGRRRERRGAREERDLDARVRADAPADGGRLQAVLAVVPRGAPPRADCPLRAGEHPGREGDSFRSCSSGEASPERMAAEIERLLGDRGAREAQLEGLREVRASLGEPGAARRVAEEVARAMGEVMDGARRAVICLPTYDERENLGPIVRGHPRGRARGRRAGRRRQLAGRHRPARRRDRRAGPAREGAAPGGQAGARPGLPRRVRAGRSSAATRSSSRWTPTSPTTRGHLPALLAAARRRGPRPRLALRRRAAAR